MDTETSTGTWYDSERHSDKLRPSAHWCEVQPEEARIFYHVLKEHEPFRPMDAAEYEKQFRDREIIHLRRKATKLGLPLVESPVAIPVA